MKQQTEVIFGMNEVFKSVLENDDIIIEAATTANEVEDWDSLNHIILVVGIEKKFGIKFTSDEIHKFSNVGEMANAILKKLNND